MMWSIADLQIEDVTGEHALQVRVWQDKHVWEVVKKWCAAHKEHPADWRSVFTPPNSKALPKATEFGTPATEDAASSTGLKRYPQPMRWYVSFISLISLILNCQGLPSTQTIQSLVIPLVPSPACAIKCIPLAEPEDPDPMEEREQYSIVKVRLVIGYIELIIACAHVLGTIANDLLLDHYPRADTAKVLPGHGLR